MSVPPQNVSTSVPPEAGQHVEEKATRRAAKRRRRNRVSGKSVFLLGKLLRQATGRRRRPRARRR